MMNKRNSLACTGEYNMHRKNTHEKNLPLQVSRYYDHQVNIYYIIRYIYIYIIYVYIVLK